MALKLRSFLVAAYALLRQGGMRAACIALAILVAAAAATDLFNPMTAALADGQPIEVILGGLDDSQGTHRTDVIIVARIDPQAPAIKIIQIPRDTLVLAAGKNTKINSIYGKTGITGLKQHIAALLPSAGLPRKYLIVDFAGFLEVLALTGPLRLGGEPTDAETALESVRVRDQSGD
ncbi:MAG: LCP family protein, partial [Elusimicrobiota bacterium]